MLMSELMCPSESRGAKSTVLRFLLLHRLVHLLIKSLKDDNGMIAAVDLDVKFNVNNR